MYFDRQIGIGRAVVAHLEDDRQHFAGRERGRRPRHDLAPAEHVRPLALLLRPKRRLHRRTSFTKIRLLIAS